MQLLEDAAILVFLQDQMATFARQHSEYPREKFIEIIKKCVRYADESNDLRLLITEPGGNFPMKGKMLQNH